MVSRIAVGSSHIRKFDSKLSADAHVNMKCVPSISEFHSFPGLKVLPPMSRAEVIKLRNFQNTIINTTAEEILLVNLSNDWQEFLTSNQELLPVAPTVLERWCKSSVTQRLSWKLKYTKLTKASRVMLEKLISEYRDFLDKTIKKSTVRKIYQLSVLERVYVNLSNPHLDILFSALNSSLRLMCKRLLLTNVKEESVMVKFISVQGQYQKTAEIANFREIYRPSETGTYHGPDRYPQNDTMGHGNGLVHRNLESYIQIFKQVEVYLQKQDEKGNFYK